MRSARTKSTTNNDSTPNAIDTDQPTNHDRHAREEQEKEGPAKAAKFLRKSFK